MREFTLKVSTRDKTGSASLNRKRTEGSVPAVIYGHGIENRSLWVRSLDFAKMYQEAGESSIINLVGEDGKAVSALIHDVQLNPLTHRFSHVDFFQVRMDEELETHVPLEFIGDAPAVRELGGVLVKPLEEVEIKCLPKNLPHSISVDISKLITFADHIQVKDLSLPAGVEMLTEPGTAVALVEAPRSEAEMAALDEKVEADVTKVEGVVKEETPAAEATEEKKSEE